MNSYKNVLFAVNLTSPAVVNSQNQSFSMIPPAVPIRPSSVTQPSVIQPDEFDMLNLNGMLKFFLFFFFFKFYIIGIFSCSESLNKCNKVENLK